MLTGITSCRSCFVLVVICLFHSHAHCDNVLQVMLCVGWHLPLLSGTMPSITNLSEPLPFDVAIVLQFKSQFYLMFLYSLFFNTAWKKYSDFNVIYFAHSKRKSRSRSRSASPGKAAKKTSKSPSPDRKKSAPISTETKVKDEPIDKVSNVCIWNRDSVPYF